MTAPANVPMCRATSKVLFRLSLLRMLQWKSQGTRIRCPELETGANSVNPCVMPSTMAWKMLVIGPRGIVRAHWRAPRRLHMLAGRGPRGAKRTESPHGWPLSFRDGAAPAHPPRADRRDGPTAVGTDAGPASVRAGPR